MYNKKIITSVAGVAVVGAIAFLGYKVVKELSKIGDDIDWGDLNEYYGFKQGTDFADE